jgi:hypothetical protein
MSFFQRYGPATLKGAKMAFQFACFAHCFNQYVGQITWVSKKENKTKKNNVQTLFC